MLCREAPCQFGISEVGGERGAENIREAEERFAGEFRALDEVDFDVEVTRPFTSGGLYDVRDHGKLQD